MKKSTKIMGGALIAIFSFTNLTGCFTECPEGETNCATVAQLGAAGALLGYWLGAGSANNQQGSGSSEEE